MQAQDIEALEKKQTQQLKVKNSKVGGGGGGSVTLCQLMNICDSLPLGELFSFASNCIVLNARAAETDIT
jgi:hypothetical protein